MSLIEKLIGYADVHPRAVVVGMLGLIVAGAVGGGLWIKSLQSTLAERDRMLKERLELVELRHKHALRISKQGSAYLREELTTLKNGLGNLDVALNETADAIMRLAANLDPAHPELLSLRQSVDGLNSQSQTILQAMDKAEAISDLAMKMLALTTPPSFKKTPSMPIFSLPVLTIATLLVITGLAWIGLWLFYPPIVRARLRRIEIVSRIEEELGITVVAIEQALRKAHSIDQLLEILMKGFQGFTFYKKKKEIRRLLVTNEDQIKDARRLLKCPPFYSHSHHSRDW